MATPQNQDFLSALLGFLGQQNDPLGQVARSNSRPAGLTSNDQWASMFGGAQQRADREQQVLGYPGSTGVMLQQQGQQQPQAPAPQPQQQAPGMSSLLGQQPVANDVNDPYLNMFNFQPFQQQPQRPARPPQPVASIAPYLGMFNR